MGRPSSVARFGLVVGAVAFAVVMAEGVVSLATGDSLLFPRPILRSKMLDAERIAAAALTEGPFAVDEDSVVAFRTKAGGAYEFFEVPATTDRFGMRVRLGPEVEDGALRVVVLGDSYVFGFGVVDAQTLGHHLESVLAAVVPDGAARPVVFTVAATGWNTANQIRYLQNHLGRLDPDVVIAVPVANDLDDSFSVSETGQLLKPAAPRAPFAGVDQYTTFVIEMARRSRPFLGAAVRWPLLLTDVSPRSRARWDAWVAALRELHTRLDGRGARLLVAHPQNDEFALVAQDRLRAQLPDVAQIGLLGPRDAADTLDGDPHPSGKWNAAAALVLAETLVARGWVPHAEPAKLPPLPVEYTDKRLPIRSAQDAAQWREGWRAAHGAVIDLTDFTGFQQIYGGVDADGTVGMSCAFGLRAPAPSGVRVELERLPTATAVYPLRLTLEGGDGAVLGTVEVPAPTDSPAWSHRFALPAPAPESADHGLDFLLRADNWVAEAPAGTTRLAAFRLRRVILD